MSILNNAPSPNQNTTEGLENGFALSRDQSLTGDGDKENNSGKDSPSDEASTPEVKFPQTQIYLTLLLHGVGTLMPWNMFINAKDYFVNYKLGTEHTGTSTSEYGDNFLAYIGIASQLPSLLFNWINIFIPCRGSLNYRVIWSLFVEIVLFIFTIILAMLDTSNTPAAFFWLTILTVVIINIAGGIYQNSVYGIAAKLNRAEVLILGSNISGTFTSITNLVSMALAPTEKNAAVFYFSTALVILFLCVCSYVTLPRNRFYRYKESQFSHYPSEEAVDVGVSIVESNSSVGPPYLLIFKQCWPQCLNVFLVFFVTLAVFPTVHSDVKRVGEDFIIPEKYFVGITCYLTFNLFAMIGGFMTSFVQWPGPDHLWIPITARFLFIPFFILCNYQPRNVTRVFVSYFTFGDWIYWIGGALLGLSNGYYSALAMTYCPRSVKNQHAPYASMFGAACLITGVFIGINFTLLIPIFVGTVNL